MLIQHRYRYNRYPYYRRAVGTLERTPLSHSNMLSVWYRLVISPGLVWRLWSDVLLLSIRYYSLYGDILIYRIVCVCVIVIVE